VTEKVRAALKSSGRLALDEKEFSVFDSLSWTEALKRDVYKRQLSYRISVDGGINEETGADCARAGADTFVAGTSLFGATDMKSAVTQLRRSVSEAVAH